MAEPQRHPEEFREPSTTDLAAIEQEMPLIEAEVMLLDAQITLLFSDAAPSEVDWQRLRRAQRRVLREARALLAVRNLSVRQVA
ncbi:DUF6284 family protein [Micromonospora inyonensis]|uniref:Uncharacterized protein n=1 Tax=Micromonospora inyonensis TaxID=47866 RepID=A0A1C6R754_9ACTN|nr:DUF6284 family protein [Micromonospora inyonensis]SCL12852.1 hypothetical protein GA0074694_0035 [Micromonospora inyonensis]